MDKLAYYQTWELVRLPPGKKVLRGQWVLDQKTTPEGAWTENRARWVVCGNREKTLYEWFEVFSAVAHLASLRLFLTLVAVKDLEYRAFNIVIAFLNADIPPDIDIYIDQPYGFNDGIGKVCRLKRALYRLRLSPRLWFETITGYLNKMGFPLLENESCLFINKAIELILLVYIDNILVTGKEAI